MNLGTLQLSSSDLISLSQMFHCCEMVMFTPRHYCVDLRYSKSPPYEPSCCTVSKMGRCVPSTSGTYETAAGPLSPIADDASALPSPISSPSLVSNFSSCEFWPPLYAGYSPV